MSEVRKLYGFLRNVGFEPTSYDMDQRMEMMLEPDESKDEAEDLQDEDLDTENTWPSRRPTNG